jgi:hypothetical protein
MKLLLKLFPAGHLVIAALFVGASLALIALAAAQLWTGIQLFDDAGLIERLNAVLESIAVLTVALAALELGQTILEEEVVRGIGLAAAVLLAAWGLFIRLNRSAEELEPEAMQQAKREDRKIDNKGDKR